MKTFFRVLQYANGFTSKLIQFFIFSILGIVFSAVSLVSVIPMLQVLFDQVKTATVPAKPEFTFSAEYFIKLFEYHFISVIHEYGKPEALLFVCLCIVAAVLIGNTFRYLERVVASQLRIDIVRNLRTAISKR